MKHAYLIAVHNQFGILYELLKKIDNENNDIFLHIDKKVKIVNFDLIKSCVKKSKLFFLKRRKVTWGDFSQIKLEIDFLKISIKNKYDYYHYISGVDYPIKSLVEINNFFEKNNGKEFIDIDNSIDNTLIEYRISLYHFLQKFIGKKNNFIFIIEKVILRIEKMFKINRIKNSKLIYKKGSNWFSITHKLANFIIENEKEIIKDYKNTRCGDEIFLQTIVYNSEFKKTLYYSKSKKSYCNMRLVDWKRGNPYVYSKEDYNNLKKSDCLFARKFSEEKSIELINLLR